MMEQMHHGSRGRVVGEVFSKIRGCIHCLYLPDVFKAKMHQIQCWLGLCPKPRWGSFSTGFKGPYFKGETGKGSCSKVLGGIDAPGAPNYSALLL